MLAQRQSQWVQAVRREAPSRKEQQHEAHRQRLPGPPPFWHTPTAVVGAAAGLAVWAAVPVVSTVSDGAAALRELVVGNLVIGDLRARVT